MADKEDLVRSSNVNLFLFIFLSCFCIINASSVFNFDINHPVHTWISQSDANKRFKRDSSVDEKCTNQESEFLQDLTSNTTKIDYVHTFHNESRYAMALAWAGENDGTLIIVTTDSKSGATTNSSRVYRSTDFGKTKTKLNITDGIKKHNGLQRNPHDPKKVYLVGEKQFMYVTEDGGINFVKYTLPFMVAEEIIFHSSPDYSFYLMAKDASDQLYRSFDNGKNWKMIQSNVDHVTWGIVPDESSHDTKDTIYALVSDSTIRKSTLVDKYFNLNSDQKYALKKSTNGGDSWKTLADYAVNFERKGKFLYVSVQKDPKTMSDRQLLISTDGGATLHEAQLPTIQPDQFYSVMDIEDNMIFMHVDDVSDSGHGVLYTSASDGIIYSQSLINHLFPNYGQIHDFYKVKSMRGVYITSQMGSDDSIHSVITYNRGATWEKIPRPAGVPCKDESKECYLQIHGMYSLKRNILSSPPLSEESAVGLILAHGHVAESLQRTEPDVYISSDGGYTWRQTLTGAHHYQIGDQGGLLVAVEKSKPNPNTIKFSTDAGHCWHTYKYTDKVLNFTGLLTEPEGKSAVVMIWGYDPDKKWEVHIIDFKDVLKQQCSDNDYEPWISHFQYRADKGAEAQGCYLGEKETYLLLKKDSWCYNGYEHEKTSTRATCPCTREDYECDYGFYRPENSDLCVKVPNFIGPQIDICFHGHEEELVSQGYRKIPGDRCDKTKGFSPSSKMINLKVQCNERSKSLFEGDETKQPVSNGMSKGVKLFAIILVFIVFIIIIVMSGYFLRKYILLRRHKTEYRFSLLNENEHQNGLLDRETDDDNDWDQDLDRALSSTVKYHDSDEEELTTSSRPNSSRQQNGRARPPQDVPAAIVSYHDDSDDDLLS